MITRSTYSRLAARRRGTVMAMTAVVLPVMAILAAFAINAAHMQLTRTELSIATDAAARAGGRAFSEIQTVDSAIDAAVATAALNDVDGEPLRLRSGDNDGEIEFGISFQSGGFNSRYEFEQIPTADVRAGTVASSLRVNGNRISGSLSGDVPLIIPGLMNTNRFSTTAQSVAMQVDRDISLILDRSGSMTEVDFDWNSGESPWYENTKYWGYEQGMLNRWWNDGWRYSYRSGWNSITYQQAVYEDYYEKGIAPTTPWQDLVDAVDAFLDVLETTSQEEQVSLASYATSATLDTLLEKNHTVVRNQVNQLNTGGWTAIGSGMEEGIQGLADARARPFAAKTMVVMTDGVQNREPWAEDIAEGLVANNLLTIHTVTFGDGANQLDMQEVARIGGGRHYHAATGEDLIRIFEEIANN
ncbi:MAG: VWA domain-containing protein, partial [Planctomycetota bacterium]